MIRRPPRSTRTDTLFPYTTLSDLEEERILFAVRNQDRALAANQIIDEVLFDRQWVERMSASDLIRTSSALNSMMWQATLGIDKLIERSEEHTSELQSLMRTSYAVFCLKKKNQQSEHYTDYT